MFDFEYEPTVEYTDDIEGNANINFRPTRLNLQDYNLNSPLTKDLNIKIEKKSRGELDSTRNRELDLFIENHGQHLHPWDQNHKLLSDILSKECEQTTWFDDIWSKTHADANLTVEIVNIFLNYFNQPTKSNHDKNNLPREIRKWGQLFMETAILTIFMNNSDNEKAIKLIRFCEKPSFKSKRRCQNQLYEFPMLGEVEISRYGIIKSDCFLCKNFILMVKDITGGRVFSYTSMIDRIDTAVTDRDLLDFVNIWVLGDQLLKMRGNESYDCFKLIEPISNNAMINMAQRIRPEIHLKSEFEEFVQGDIQKYSDQGIYFPKILSEILESNSNLEFHLGVYGFFRMWGHPYIQHEEGLAKLYEQVTCKKTINDELAQSLASDLAFKVLEKKFNEHRKWFVKKDEVDKADPLYEYVQTDTWPPSKVLSNYGDKFHLLPLEKCFEIPDFIDPTLIYSDKAHSLPRDDLIADISTNRNGPCRTQRVLDTLIHTDFTYWKEFLQEINDYGLEEKWLVIGLKAKERELKIIGRYFALLSWKLREYFVVTEYLIKIHFIKLYDGLTMADDLKGVLSKLINRSMYQGSSDYNSVTFANHIDYSKWNNHQRKESNKYVFRVMGQFLGYPNLFERTHEFFEKSLIYYAGDRSLLRVSEGKIINSGSVRACWEGQAGGLEGLRQKGWSLLNIILLERIARKRNTKIKLLAQGDNQVVCTSFKLTNTRKEHLQKHLAEVIEQNQKIMEDIKHGTADLGLIINQEETMISTEYLNYGKVPVFRGNICGLKMKRWARVNCFSNDNLPNLSNVISTVSSTALSVSHFSVSFVDPIYNYNFYGNLAKNLLEIFDPCVGGPLKFKRHRLVSSSKALFLDPSLGGVCGMNLNRFLIRNFPDPITESLSFWNLIYQNTNNPIIKRICCNAGNPSVQMGLRDDYRSLLEDPTSINIPRGLSPLTMLRNEIRQNMLSSAWTIKNGIIKDITLLGNREDEELLDFVRSTKPLFPRFISQLKSSTACGIRDSIVGMYENSKTIRKFFLDNLRDDFDEKVIQSELDAVKKLDLLLEMDHMGWSCSASKADQLREMSWGNEIVGMTIPHPSELFDRPTSKSTCKCIDSSDDQYITTVWDNEQANLYEERGSLIPYLGSQTSEGTSIITPWERDSKIPFIKRIMKIRTALNWFVNPNSNLGKSVCNIIEAVTGYKIEAGKSQNKRTGSAIHRFSAERQSCGGYNAISPTTLTRLFTTTDTLGNINKTNYDFMYQSAIIFMQTLLSRPLGYILQGKRVYHSHIKCTDCLREITEIEIESEFEFKPESMRDLIVKWIPDLDEAWKMRPEKIYPNADISRLPYGKLNYQVGVTTGFAFAEMSVKGDDAEGFSRLFPNSISSKLDPEYYLKGLIQGVINCSALNCLSRRSLNTLRDPFTSIGGNVITIINYLTSNAQFLSLCKGENLTNHFLNQPHRVPPSYPLNIEDQVSIIKSVMREYTSQLLVEKRESNKDILLFPDIIGTDLEMSLQLGSEAYNILISKQNKKSKIEKLRQIKDLNIQFRSKENIEFNPTTISIHFVNQEIRHVLKFHTDVPKIEKTLIQFGHECSGKVYAVPVTYRYLKGKEIQVSVPEISNPLISGLRLFQMATGAHYKLRSIIQHFNVRYNYFLCGGDGSGGMTSCLLRLNPNSIGVFNSLLKLGDSSTRGTKPSPPSAIHALGQSGERCLNLNNCWENPTDLCDQATWEYFRGFTFKEKFDLMVFDMELTDYSAMDRILTNLDYYVTDLLKKTGVVIFKTYLHVVVNIENNPLKTLSSWFRDVYSCQTEFTSSHSSELYIVGFKLDRHRVTKNIDPDCLIQIINDNFVFKSSREEFIRAKEIRKKDLMGGVHFTLRTPLRVDIENLLNSGGVPNGISHRLSNELEHCDLNNVDLKWELIKIIDHFCFESGWNEYNPKLPSDQQIQGSLSVMMGILYSLSLDYDEDKQEAFVNLINKGFFIFINNVLKDDRYKVTWDIGKSGKYINLRSKLATIGNGIRTCEKLGDRLKVYNYKPNKNWLTKKLTHTGIPTIWNLKRWTCDESQPNTEDWSALDDINIQEMSYDF
ncbi:polymerase [Matariya virus]|uniref:Replicase n=3 Tax=Sunrhavirus TaxID=2733254 RepID=A0AAE8XC50_9RHAB|nr:polymerase [Matariya virus]UAU42909.1 polymerase [Matariya virus]WAD86868.1 polymerase [Matariya virus]